jgi:type II secretion system protein I
MIDQRPITNRRGRRGTQRKVMQLRLGNWKSVIFGIQFPNFKFQSQIPPLRPSASSAVNRRGFTLLEMILSLAILAGAMAAIGELVRLGGARSSQAVELTQAELLAESVMAEIAAGVRTSDPVFMAPYEEAETDADGQPMWLYSIETESTAEPGMLSIRVTVARNDDDGGGGSGGGTEYSLVRWMIDPETLSTLSAANISGTGTGGQP